MTKTHVELLKAVQDRCVEEIKDAKESTDNSINHVDQQYHIGRKHAAKDILRDISKIEFKSKEAEFFEELKEYIAFFKGFSKENYFLKVVCGRIIKKIEQFQAEVKDENSR